MTDAAPTTAAELVLLRLGDDHPGLLFEGQTWSWHEVMAEASGRAAWLAERRQPGPFHIGVLLENTPEFLFLIAAAALAGATVVGLNPTRRGAELGVDIAHADCQLVVTDSTQVALLDASGVGLDPSHIVVTDGEEYLAEIAGLRGTAPPPAMPGPDDLYLLIFTSGSTGAPKAVRFSQGRAARAATRVPFSSDDVLYVAMPLFHGNSLNSSVFPAFASGATIALRRRFSASQFLPDVRATGATFASTVGRAIAHLLSTEPTDHDRDHRLAYVLGPETSEPDKAAFVERFGAPLFEGYGSSENAIVLLPEPRRAGALGRAQKGDDIAVVDANGVERPVARFDDNGALLNADEAIGELVGRNVVRRFEGYYKNAAAEAERTRNGWYWSGDLAYRDEDGVFFFAGRAGDWLRVDSENFAAAPVERIMCRYAAASGAAVYAVPDARTGDQVMVALEVAKPETFDPHDFAAFLAAQSDLGTKWSPRYIRVMRALPVTGTDKLNKLPLRATRWETTDPVWHRLGRSTEYVPMTDADRVALAAEFAANGRTNLLV